MTKMKKASSDRRPYDTRPVSLIRPNKVMSQDALNRFSRYEEVNRQFAQEFPQMAWKFEPRPWIPWFLSSRTEPHENMTTASADNSTSPDASTLHVPFPDFEFITSADCNFLTHNDDADFDILSATMSRSMARAASPAERSDNSDSFASLDSDFDPLSDLDAFSSLSPWYNQIQEPCYNHTTQSKNVGGMEEQEQLDRSGLMVSASPFAQPAKQSTMLSPEGESSGFGNEAPTENSCVDSVNMNQILLDLNQLGGRLREDARRQLDAMSGGCATSPMCFCEG